MEAFQGKLGTQTKTAGAARGKVTNGGGSTPSTTEPTEESLLLLKSGGQWAFSEGPCKGCGTPFQHRTPDRSAVSHQQCPMRAHPDWNHDNIPFSESAAGRRMKEQKIPFISNMGVISKKGALMTRLSTHYRAIVDAARTPVKLDSPTKLQWQDARRLLGWF